MKKYKYILFDADNTLFDFDASEKKAIEEIFKKYGIDLLYIPKYSEINKSLWSSFECGEISRDLLKVKRFELIFAEANIPATDFSKVSEEYIQKLGEQSILYKDSLEVCKKLRESDKKIYIVTNGNTSVQKKRFGKSEIRNYIEDIFISEDIGISKPSKKFFDFVLRNIAADRSDCLIIGDSLTSDILGGINSGIDTCWYNPKKVINTKSYSPTYTVNSLWDIFGIIGE